MDYITYLRRLGTAYIVFVIADAAVLIFLRAYTAVFVAAVMVLIASIPVMSRLYCCPSCRRALDLRIDPLKNPFCPACGCDLRGFTQ